MRIKVLITILLTFQLCFHLEGQEIFRAIRNTDMVKIKELAPKEANTRNPNNFTPAHYAVISGQPEILQILIDQGANISERNNDGDTPLNLAVTFGNKELTEMLLNHQAKYNGTGLKAQGLLLSSAQNGFDRMFRFILETEANQLLANEAVKEWILQDVVTGGSVNILKELISKGVSINKGQDIYGWTLLHYAASKGQSPMADYLIKMGIGLNKRTKAGETAYNLAQKNNNEEIQKLIEKSGGAKDAMKFPALKGEYLGQKKPGMKPDIFAPGIVSRPDLKEISGTFSPDGTEYYYYGYTNKTPSRIFASTIQQKRWTAPEEIAFTKEFEGSEPLITRDNQSFFFIWANPNSPVSPAAYWVSERKDNGWAQPTFAGQGMWLTQSKNGQLYTTAVSSNNNSRSMDIAKVFLEDNRFAKFENIVIPSVTGGTAHPTIAPDESYIFFDRGGGDHVQLSFKNSDGSWGEPINLTEHGFEPLFGLPTLSPDGKYLFFKQGCRGAYDVAHGDTNRDIWWVDIKVIENLRPKK